MACKHGTPGYRLCPECGVFGDYQHAAEHMADLEAELALLLLPSSDRLAAACLRAVDRGVLDPRSEIGDALLDWCGVRTGTSDDEISAFRRILSDTPTD